MKNTVLEITLEADSVLYQGYEEEERRELRLEPACFPAGFFHSLLVERKKHTQNQIQRAAEGDAAHTRWKCGGGRSFPAVL